MPSPALIYVPRVCGSPQLGDVFDVYAVDEPAWYVGTGSGFGFLRREPFDHNYRGSPVPSFRIGEKVVRAEPDRDVLVPIVGNRTFFEDLEYVPSYPFCPDCGGALVPDRHEYAAPGVRLCVGDPDHFPEGTPHSVLAELGIGCGSRFLDSRDTAAPPTTEREATP